MDKVNEVFERCVQMSLLLQRNDVIKMGVVYMSIHSEQPLQDGLGYCDEITRKRNT